MLLIALSLAMIVAAQDTVQEVVDAHNVARAAVGVGPVSWDDTVAATTRSPTDGLYGENIFWSSGTNWTAVEAVNFWVAEKQYYDHDSNTCSAPATMSCEHYTQVVWSNTTVIGCARTVCDGDGGSFGICGYNPPGNVEGQTPY